MQGHQLSDLVVGATSPGPLLWRRASILCKAPLQKGLCDHVLSRRRVDTRRTTECNPIGDCKNRFFVQEFAKWRNVAISPSPNPSFFSSLRLEPRLHCNGRDLGFAQRADAKDSEISEWTGGPYAERPNSGRKRGGVAEIPRTRKSGPWFDSGLERRNARRSGRSEVSRALRSRQHRAQELSGLHPRMD